MLYAVCCMLCVCVWCIVCVRGKQERERDDTHRQMLHSYTHTDTDRPNTLLPRESLTLQHTH